jgi:hypothetical protein
MIDAVIALWHLLELVKAQNLYSHGADPEVSTRTLEVL